MSTRRAWVAWYLQRPALIRDARLALEVAALQRRNGQPAYAARALATAATLRRMAGEPA